MAKKKPPPLAATTQVVSPTLTPNVYKPPTRAAITFEPPPTYPAILTSPAKELIQRRWLQGIPCKAPCWEGIIPGKTTVDEALIILRQNVLIGNAEVSTTGVLRPVGYVTWKWNSNNALGGQTGGASFDPKSPQQIIRRITPGYTKSFLFSDIINAFGEPSHIDAYVVPSPDIGDKSISYGIIIVYLNQGFRFDIRGNSKPILSQDLPLSRLIFYPPTKDGYFVATDSKTLPLAWEGFKGFDYYCRYSGSKISNDCKTVTG